ncbi:unnamed protein product [Citrullus colocynthis]|uniref:Uncharacterized protein n=1 Tax=Citrullus colocynthis TaxID=252529 RepID=A0ABP0Y3B2_9ROSI
MEQVSLNCFEASLTFDRKQQPSNWLVLYTRISQERKQKKPKAHFLLAKTHATPSPPLRFNPQLEQIRVIVSSPPTRKSPPSFSLFSGEDQPPYELRPVTRSPFRQLEQRPTTRQGSVSRLFQERFSSSGEVR